MSTLATANDPALTTEDCRFCWMCRHVCPVGHVTKRETLTPHAWALLVASVKRGTLQWNAETADVLYQCADCGMCRTHCVTDRPLPEAIALARAEVVAAGHAPRAAYALRDDFERALKSDTAAAFSVPKADVVLFAGASARNGGARSLDAALALLEKAGSRPATIGHGRSNGVVASALGFPDTARRQAQAVLAEVAATGARRVLTLSTEDRYAFERLYRDRLGLEWPGAVEVVDVPTTLAEALADGRLAFRQRLDAPPYAYHDPCHAPRIGRDGAASRTLLNAALGPGSRQLFWRVERAHPCGAVGGLDVTQPQLAAQLADARLADAAAAGAAWLVTDDAACLSHLQSRSTSGITVVGFYGLLVDQIEE
jgi:Fe-S oxidoreductase